MSVYKTFIFYPLFWAALIFSLFFSSKRYLHMAQLEGYKPGQYARWLRVNAERIFFRESLIILLTSLAAYLVFKIDKTISIKGAVVFIIWFLSMGYYSFYLYGLEKKAKKPLVFTKRATRLFVFELLLSAASIYFYCAKAGVVFADLMILSIIVYVIPVYMLVATVLTTPLEMHIQNRYFIDAREKIKKMKNLKVIGITGSYGKTSTKYFTATLLKQKYNTLMTPESYNTPMGVTKVIREQLTDLHEVFVCEMGARYKGDIRKLCDLVNPTIGVVTSIGPQHLETFHSIENIIDTKFELIESLPDNGISILNGDNEYIIKKVNSIKTNAVLYGMNSNSQYYITACGINNSREGLKFKVRTADGIEFDCRTSLLGRHNVSNLLAAICVALKMGLTVGEIQAGLREIKPVPHRLQILDTDNGVTVIDDAFNSNPEGVRQALEVLKEIEGRKKIIVTPGMVELGAVESEENRKMGRLMARCCDYAIIVGKKRTRPIVEGLMEENFPPDNIKVVPNLDEATKVLSSIVRQKDVVLFENDLPDNYDE
ncbi:MAG: UDP-N-acetylmuramoyl-tripeptide--D-alanyl-D-alanine ligase [Tepidanaerobacteraceae bacterium]|nr:UDP-N-acetylmuramoyl-tripeptide--D-alanyl-D-alanine ligase [Tepidanaerobacteraceae bacterium]